MADRKHPKIDVRALEPSNTNLASVGLPRPIAEYLLTLPRVQIPKELGETPAGVGIATDGGYVLAVNDGRFSELTTEQKQVVLLHEYTHIMYGHIPYAQLNKLNPQLFNYAADSWINEGYDPKLVDSLKGIRYTLLRKEVPQLPLVMPSPRIIYDVLIAQGKEALASAMGQDVLMLPEGEMSPDQLGTVSLEQLAAQAALDEALASGDLDPRLKNLLERVSQGAAPSGPRASGTPAGPPIPCPWLAGIIATLRGMSKHAEYMRRRGWYREARNPLVAGVTRRPGPLVLLGIDVSGSTSPYWGTLVSTARLLSRQYRVLVVLYSDAIIYSGPVVPEHVELSGGTNFAPLWRLADTLGAALTVNVTDGDNFDKNARLPRSPVAWVWLPGSTTHGLRPGDKSYAMEGGNE